MAMSIGLPRRRLADLKGTTIEAVGLSDPSSEGDYIVLYTSNGMRLYADRPTVYTDDSGDRPASEA